MLRSWVQLKSEEEETELEKSWRKGDRNGQNTEEKEKGAQNEEVED